MSFANCLCALRSDTNGAVAVIAAILFPVLIGAMGIGSEAGYWYLTQRKLQHAADVSAHAAAVRKRAGDATSGMAAAATHIAQESGLLAAGTVTVNSPPTSGALAGDANGIEVILTEMQPPLLSSLFLSAPVRLQGRAVVRLDATSQACVLALSPAAPAAVKVSGSTTVTLNGCDVASNSSAPDALTMAGGGSLTTDCAYTVGGAITSSSLSLQKCDSVRIGAPKTIDPYADLEEPVATGACNSKSNFNADAILEPSYQSHPSGLPVMRFCSGLSVTGGKVTFKPGLYIIESGSLSVNAGTVLTGAGVTFYFAKGAELKLNGGATVNLSAPTTGPYSGLLFFGSRGSSGITHQVNGASGSTFDGAIYFPASGVEYSGRSGSTGGCTQIIGSTVTFTGNSDVRSDCIAKGARAIVTDRSIKIVE
ncbi:pilus assembly protein TadG-related protein [Microvirga yunnanensis]|uniref:pilus assembly protein TadG-related protein n=1 Tax=Microvirga yunnanensis TaxID=2953740 RepID=UPI0021C997E9|nr:pilus assembly protein TadG-related protein [Microvirga sp. HBU65207]